MHIGSILTYQYAAQIWNVQRQRLISTTALFC